MKSCSDLVYTKKKDSFNIQVVDPSPMYNLHICTCSWLSTLGEREKPLSRCQKRNSPLSSSVEGLYYTHTTRLGIRTCQCTQSCKMWSHSCLLSFIETTAVCSASFLSKFDDRCQITSFRAGVSVPVSEIGSSIEMLSTAQLDWASHTSLAACFTCLDCVASRTLLCLPVLCKGIYIILIQFCVWSGDLIAPEHNFCFFAWRQV